MIRVQVVTIKIEPRLHSAGAVPSERARLAQVRIHSRKFAWLSGRVEGPCCMMSTSKSPVRSNCPCPAFQ